MIFYGTRATNIKNGQIRNVTCPNCETNTSMTYSVFGKYAHIYWIPLFPYKKVGVTECNECKKTFEFKELPAEIQTKLTREKENNPPKYPIWYFSGLFIIVLLIGYGIYSSQKKDADTQAFYENPKEGDIYETKTETGAFTTMKFIAESKNKDSLYFYVNEMEIDNSSAINQIDIEKYYKEIYSFEKTYLDSLYKAKYIYKINRNN